MAYARAEYVAPGQLTTSFKEYFSGETGATVAGLTAGILAGEFVGELISSTFELEGWNAILARGATKIGLSFGLFMVGRRMPLIGLARPMLYAASAGVFTSWILDVIAELIPGSPGWAGKLGGNIGATLRGKTGATGKTRGNPVMEPRIEIESVTDAHLIEEELQMRQ